MKESSKERIERKVVVVEKNVKEKATTPSRAGRAHEECPLNVVTTEDIERFVDIFNTSNHMENYRIMCVTLDAHNFEVPMSYFCTVKQKASTSST